MSIVLSTTRPTSIPLHPPSQRSLSPALTNLSVETRRRTQADRVEADAPNEPDDVPEGGKGWLVAIACSMLMWWAVGTLYCWGIMQAVLLDNGLAATSTLAFVGSLSNACCAFFAIVNTRIAGSIGARTTSILGIFLLGLGEILSSFSYRSLGGLFTTSGAISGIGASLCFMVAIVTPAQYFKRKRGIANGIVFAGGGIGGAVISYMLTGLLGSVGIEWTYRILGFVTLATGIPAAWFVQERHRSAFRSSGLVEWHLFRDIRFTLLFVAAAITTFTLFVPPFFLPLYTVRLGFSPTAAAGFLVALNIASALGRVLCGFACDTVGPINTLLVALSINAFSILVIWLESTSLAPLTVFAIFNGLGNGGFFSTMPTVVGSTVRSSISAVATAMTITGYAGGYLFGGPIAGYLLTSTGGASAPIESWRPAIFYAGFMALGAAALVAVVRVLTSRMLLKKC